MTVSIKTVIAAKIARAILASFESMFAEFLNITLAAQSRFERAAWLEVQESMRSRLKIYEAKVSLASQAIHIIAYKELEQADIWHLAKNDFAKMVEKLDNAQIAQTFFNSVFGHIWGHKKIRDVQLFILNHQFAPKNINRNEILCKLDSHTGLIDAIRLLISHFKFHLNFEDLERDIKLIHQVLNKFDGDMLSIENCHIEFSRSLFFRNKAAYIIGQIIDDDDGRNVPFAIPILNNKDFESDGELYLDAFIIGEDQLSTLFGFARAYFMVDTDQPARYVDYLCELLPKKEKFELFNAIGFIKHAKTEFYRFKVDSTRKMPASENYISAPGIKGMVMTVFTTQNSDYVYKVIKDTFKPPKNTTKQEVMDKYEFVKNADRVGRLVDTHEFRYLAFDLSRFSKDLLCELHQDVSNTIIISGNALIFKHIYVERKMTPLNLYVKTATDLELSEVMFDYGNAIKQLAQANIFPGDMLMKNFGVTRWGKVVFYDYDEICPLTECEFKKIPTPDNYYDELSDEPWFDIAQNDVYPEQFPVFFAGNPQARQYFNLTHKDIYTVNFWQSVQQAINKGYIADVFPYKTKWRLTRSSLNNGTKLDEPAGGL